MLLLWLELNVFKLFFSPMSHLLRISDSAFSKEDRKPVCGIFERFAPKVSMMSAHLLADIPEHFHDNGGRHSSFFEHRDGGVPNGMEGERCLFCGTSVFLFLVAYFRLVATADLHSKLPAASLRTGFGRV